MNIFDAIGTLIWKHRAIRRAQRVGRDEEVARLRGLSLEDLRAYRPIFEAHF